MSLVCVSIVTYGSDLNEIRSNLCGREPTATLDRSLTYDLDLISSEINRRSNSVWNGNTVISAGIDLATNELINGMGSRRYADKVMIVLTDGNPTAGDAVAAARNAKQRGIRLYTITFSVDANQAHMREVATVGSGIEGCPHQGLYRHDHAGRD